MGLKPRQRPKHAHWTESRSRFKDVLAGERLILFGILLLIAAFVVLLLLLVEGPRVAEKSPETTAAYSNTEQHRQTIN